MSGAGCVCTLSRRGVGDHRHIRVTAPSCHVACHVPVLENLGRDGGRVRRQRQPIGEGSPGWLTVTGGEGDVSECDKFARHANRRRQGAP